MPNGDRISRKLEEWATKIAQGKFPINENHIAELYAISNENFSLLLSKITDVPAELNFITLLRKCKEAPNSENLLNVADAFSRLPDEMKTHFRAMVKDANSIFESKELISSLKKIHEAIENPFNAKPDISFDDYLKIKIPSDPRKVIGVNDYIVDYLSSLQPSIKRCVHESMANVNLSRIFNACDQFPSVLQTSGESLAVALAAARAKSEDAYFQELRKITLTFLNKTCDVRSGTLVLSETIKKALEKHYAAFLDDEYKEKILDTSDAEIEKSSKSYLQKIDSRFRDLDAEIAEKKRSYDSLMRVETVKDLPAIKKLNNEIDAIELKIEMATENEKVTLEQQKAEKEKTLNELAEAYSKPGAIEALIEALKEEATKKRQEEEKREGEEKEKLTKIKEELPAKSLVEKKTLIEEYNSTFLSEKEKKENEFPKGIEKTFPSAFLLALTGHFVKAPLAQQTQLSDEDLGSRFFLSINAEAQKTTLDSFSDMRKEWESFEGYKKTHPDANVVTYLADAFSVSGKRLININYLSDPVHADEKSMITAAGGRLLDSTNIDSVIAPTEAELKKFGEIITAESFVQRTPDEANSNPYELSPGARENVHRFLTESIIKILPALYEGIDETGALKFKPDIDSVLRKKLKREIPQVSEEKIDNLMKALAEESLTSICLQQAASLNSKLSQTDWAQDEMGGYKLAAVNEAINEYAQHLSTVKIKLSDLSSKLDTAIVKLQEEFNITRLNLHDPDSNAKSSGLRTYIAFLKKIKKDIDEKVRDPSSSYTGNELNEHKKQIVSASKDLVNSTKFNAVKKFFIHLLEGVFETLGLYKGTRAILRSEKKAKEMMQEIQKEEKATPAPRMR